MGYQPDTKAAGQANVIGAIAALLAALVLSAANVARGAMLIIAYDPARHDRFHTGADADPFLRDGADWSGVGMTANGRWGTLVSPSFVVSAAHWAPGTGIDNPLAFRAGNDPAAAPVWRTVDASWRIPGSDVWVGHLSTPVPAEIAPFLVCADLGGTFRGSEVWVLGLGSGGGTANQRLGRNLIDWAGALTVSHPDEAVLVMGFSSPAQPPIGGDEHLVRTGDSGAPVFARIAGGCVLSGITYFNDSPHDTLSGASRLSAHGDAINAIMLPYGEQLAVFPPRGAVAMPASGVVLGNGIWDVTGRHAAAPAGEDLGLDVLHDARGKLSGTATLTVAGIPLTMPVKGTVKGTGATVLLQAKCAGKDAALGVKASLKLNLELLPETRQLRGMLTGKRTGVGVNEAVAIPVMLDLPAAMDGTWMVHAGFAPPGDAATGTAVLVLSNGVNRACEGKAKGASPAVELTVKGSRTDPGAKGIKLRTVVDASRGTWATAQPGTGQAYGQRLAW